MNRPRPQKKNSARMNSAGKNSATNLRRGQSAQAPAALKGSSFKILKAEAIDLDTAADLEIGDYDFGHAAIWPLVDLIREYRSDISVDQPAYCRVEDRPLGHEWHTDKGSKGHMDWCVLSARVLLSHPREFTGGELVVRYAGEDIRFEGWRDLVVWGPDLEHMVRRHTGERRVLLMFFAAQ